jgi:hypothetical protein
MIHVSCIICCDLAPCASLTLYWRTGHYGSDACLALFRRDLRHCGHNPDAPGLPLSHTQSFLLSLSLSLSIYIYIYIHTYRSHYAVAPGLCITDREEGSGVRKYIITCIEKGVGVRKYLYRKYLYYTQTKGVIDYDGCGCARGRLAICAIRRERHSHIPYIIALGRARAASRETSDSILLASERAPTGRALSLLRPSCVCVYMYIYVYTRLTHSLTYKHIHRSRLELAEIKNGRLAMLAFSGIVSAIAHRPPPLYSLSLARALSLSLLKNFPVFRILFISLERRTEAIKESRSSGMVRFLGLFYV